jgi:hypothetical protein
MHPRAQALECPQRARLFTVLLGFDPDVTAPMLERFVVTARRGGAAATAAGGAAAGSAEPAAAPLPSEASAAQDAAARDAMAHADGGESRVDVDAGLRSLEGAEWVERESGGAKEQTGRREEAEEEEEADRAEPPVAQETVEGWIARRHEREGPQ